jgi:flagellar biosynthetic protein FliQ
MEIEQATELIRNTLTVALMTAAPLLIVGLVVGLAISLLQAVTQIQEQTLVFVPKIVAMVLAAVVVMPWVAEQIMHYAQQMFGAGLGN